MLRGGIGMKPHIRKGDQGKYWCNAPQDYIPNDDADCQEWYSYSACGCGNTVDEAYRDWVKDCIMPDEGSDDWDDFKKWMEGKDE